MKKGDKLTDSSVLALSFSAEGSVVFFTGIVAAEMRKTVAYNVKLTICKTTGNVGYSHCECAVGKGPHATCKHIVSMLLILVHFVAGGDLSVVKSCTEQLQTFKKPGKMYNGAPVPAESLGPGKMATQNTCATYIHISISPYGYASLSIQYALVNNPI
jgi:hypothetical protein